MITSRQEKILNLLIKEYIDRAEPISSELLKKKCSLAVSPATIRNDLQGLTKKGFISQPHTSAGRVPTEKGYRYFISIIFSGGSEKFPDFFAREIESLKMKIEKELNLAKKLARTLEAIYLALDFPCQTEESVIFDVLKTMDISKNTHEKTIKTIRELLREFENF